MAASSAGEVAACLVRVPTENVKQKLQAVSIYIHVCMYLYMYICMLICECMYKLICTGVYAYVNNVFDLGTCMYTHTHILKTVLDNGRERNPCFLIWHISSKAYVPI